MFDTALGCGKARRPACSHNRTSVRYRNDETTSTATPYVLRTVPRSRMRRPWRGEHRIWQSLESRQLPNSVGNPASGSATSASRSSASGWAGLATSTASLEQVPQQPLALLHSTSRHPPAPGITNPLTSTSRPKRASTSSSRVANFTRRGGAAANEAAGAALPEAEVAADPSTAGWRASDPSPTDGPGLG